MNNDQLARKGPFAAVLFDLDGTLVDTAPDMVASLAWVVESHGRPPVDASTSRANVSNGSIGLLKLAFDDVDDAQMLQLQRQFLDHYQQRVARESRVFDGLDVLLDQLDAQKMPWGVVTNKPQALTDSLLVSLRLQPRMACAISGDTLPQRKPHPAPMLLASRILDVEPARVVYVGDAARDIEAGIAAGMGTIAAGWGYITADDDPAHWNADAVATNPAELSQLLLKELT